jgi:hypothetical protein
MDALPAVPPALQTQEALPATAVLLEGHAAQGAPVLTPPGAKKLAWHWHCTLPACAAALPAGHGVHGPLTVVPVLEKKPAMQVQEVLPVLLANGGWYEPVEHAEQTRAAPVSPLPNVPPVVVADPPAAHEHVVAWVKPLVVAPDGHAAQLAEPAAAVYLFTPHAVQALLAHALPAAQAVQATHDVMPSPKKPAMHLHVVAAHVPVDARQSV